MKIAYITAGAGGMFCGSCLHDNTLASALIRQGHEALLIPTYTPLRTDEPDVSYKRVFLGGINVYLQEKSRLFRHTPWFFDRLLDARPLLRWVSRFAVNTEAAQLGDLTVSILEGEHGHQRKEVDKLVTWLADEVKPELVHLTAALLSGLVHEMKRRLRVPVLCSLQGDDIFLESLPQPHRSRCLDLVRLHCREIDGFISTSSYYADFMADYLAIPRSRVHVVLPGLNLAGHGGPRAEQQRPFTIGYFARICPEKGLHVLTEAFHLLKQTPGTEQCRLHVSGWLGGNQNAYFADIRQKLKERGLDEHFAHIEAPDHDSKVRFFHGIDVLSVPTTYREPKGLYVLESLANGVPVVQPRHGSFPELIEATGGGLIVEPEDPQDLARALRQLFDNPAHRHELGRKGKEAVHTRFHAERMAVETAVIYSQYRKFSRDPKGSANALAYGSRLNEESSGEPHMSAPFRISRRVDFADTDMAGIIHFSNYFRYMEFAEVAFLRTRGLSVTMIMGEENLSFPRVSAACDFLHPVRFDDVVDIDVHIERVGRKSVTYTFDFSHQGKPVAKGRISCVCCRMRPGVHKLESVDIPDDIRRRLLESTD